MSLVVTDASSALILAAISLCGYVIVRQIARKTRMARHSRGFFDQIPKRVD